jgi:RNA recognition motif-containing protein
LRIDANFFFPISKVSSAVIEPKVILLGVNLGGSIFTNPRSKTSMKSHPDPLLVSNLTAISMKQEIFDLFANRERRDVIG